jgi:hypothetical protein
MWWRMAPEPAPWWRRAAAPEGSWPLAKAAGYSASRSHGSIAPFFEVHGYLD